MAMFTIQDDDKCYICGELVNEPSVLKRGGGRIGFDNEKKSWYHGWCIDKLQETK